MKTLTFKDKMISLIKCYEKIIVRMQKDREFLKEALRRAHDKIEILEVSNERHS